MTRGRIGVAVLLAAALAGCGGNGGGAEALADLDLAGFAVPTAVLHDETADAYLVAEAGNGGAPAVVRVRPDGERAPWLVAGRQGVELRSPRGMALVGEDLLVADGDCVRRFDRTSGAPRGALLLPGASAAADVAGGPDGMLWIADPGVTRGGDVVGEGGMFAVGSDGAVQRLALDAAIRPVAVVAQPAAAYVATWAGGFAMVDRRGHVEPLAAAPAGELVGLGRVAPGRWLGASRAGECLFAFDLRGGPAEAVAGLALPGLGDFGFDARRGRLLLPLADGRVLLRRLPAAR